MPFWIPFVIAVAVNAVSYMLTSKPSTSAIKAADDVDVPKLPWGSPYRIIQGTVPIKSPGHAWHGDVSAKAIKSKSGKK